MDANDGTHPPPPAGEHQPQAAASWNAGASSSRARPVVDREAYEAWVNQQRSYWNAGAGSARPRELESGHHGGEEGGGEYGGAGSGDAYGQHNLQEAYTVDSGQHARQGAHAQSTNDMQAPADWSAAFLAQGGGNAAAAAAAYGQPGNDHGTNPPGGAVNQLAHFNHLAITTPAATTSAATTETPPAPASDDTSHIFIILYTMAPVPNDPNKGWHVLRSRVVPRRPGGAQLRQGRSVPPPVASPEWNVWTVGDLDYENARGGLHLDYLREVLFRLDGVSRRKVSRPTLVALVQAERQRQISAGYVVDCPPYFEERAHWYNYVQPM